MLYPSFRHQVPSQSTYAALQYGTRTVRTSHNRTQHLENDRTTFDRVRDVPPQAPRVQPLPNPNTGHSVAPSEALANAL